MLSDEDVRQEAMEFKRQVAQLRTTLREIGGHEHVMVRTVENRISQVVAHSVEGVVQMSELELSRA
eukprot:3291766-Lingulodinium_polyedra.AAC.1